MKVRITLYPYIHLQKEKERKKKKSFIDALPPPPFVLSIRFIQLYRFDFHDDSRSSTLPFPTTSPLSTRFSQTGREPNRFSVSNRTFAFSTARFIKVWIAKRNQVSLIRWYFFFSRNEKVWKKKGEGDFNRSNHFKAKSSSSSSSSLRFLEVCRFTFSGKKDQAIPLSGFDPWTLSSLLNFPGKVSPLFLVFFLKKQSGVSRFKTHLSYPSSLIPLSLLILLYPFLTWFF